MADLRAKLRARSELRQFDDVFRTARKLVEEVRPRNTDPKGQQLVKEALAEIGNVQTRLMTGLVRIDTKVALLAGVKDDALHAKVQALDRSTRHRGRGRGSRCGFGAVAQQPRCREVRSAARAFASHG